MGLLINLHMIIDSNDKDWSRMLQALRNDFPNTLFMALGVFILSIIVMLFQKRHLLKKLEQIDKEITEAYDEISKSEKAHGEDEAAQERESSLEELVGEESWVYPLKRLPLISILHAANNMDDDDVNEEIDIEYQDPIDLLIPEEADEIELNGLPLRLCKLLLPIMLKAVLVILFIPAFVYIAFGIEQVIVLISKGNVQSGSEMLNVYAFLLFCYFGLVLIIGLAAFIMPNLFYKAAKRIIKTRTKELEDLRCIIEDEEKESEEKTTDKAQNKSE